MISEKSDFLKVLSKKTINRIPLYCTGYPEQQFIENYINLYNLKWNDKNRVLIQKDYNFIKQMGFDASSMWDFRRGKGGYQLSDQLRVDAWGRIYKENWYMGDGLFKDEEIVANWNHLKLPSKSKIVTLTMLLQKYETKLDLVLTLPGLFEKTWQSMGLKYFAKCLKNNFDFIEKVANFFSKYVIKLTQLLQNAGAKIFMVADDCGYKNREFIPREIWRKIFFNKYLEIIKMIHEKDQKIIIHSDGFISDMMDIFIDLGFDAVQSLESNAGVDIFSLFKKYQNDICFIGNLDISLLSFGTPQQVEEYVTKLIKKSRETISPLIISPTQQINSKVNPKNIKTMIETTKKFDYKI
ncbi:MAG: uroporphyrinogen decarboxylase family protein [Candidatus Hodarchaeota archaeon]